MIDITGDGLPDKVFKRPNENIKYRKNLGGPGGPYAFSQVYDTGLRSDFFQVKILYIIKS